MSSRSSRASKYTGARPPPGTRRPFTKKLGVESTRSDEPSAASVLTSCIARAYCASKSGLNAFSEVLMQEVRYDNIRVSYVMPGSVATGFSSGDETKGADWKSAPEDVADVVVNLLQHNPRSLPSRVEIRPSQPKK